MDDTTTTVKRGLDDGDESEAKRVKTVDEVQEEPQVKAEAAPESETDPSLDSTAAEKKAKGKRRDAAGFAHSRKGKDKDTKNTGRRRRDRNEEDAEGKPAATEDNGEPKAPRLPKRMCALLIGFCGSGYSGMQIQNNAKTIENALFDAMVRAGAVSQDNADDPVKVNIARAARTDAGVHAAGNVVSMKMITTVPGVPDMTARINEELPPEIRLWGHVRVQNSFNPRTLCDSRKYTYFFPTYILLPPKPNSPLYRVLTEHAAASLSSSPPPPSPIVGHLFWANAESSTEAEDMARKRAWRIDPTQLEQLRTSAQKYLMTHNFHNFTVNAEFSDRSNQRVMKNIVIADPVVYGETEWISVLFHGQSFMMHQVRKMISALVLTCRTGTPPQIIDELYGPRKIFIPKMPALGLLLDQPIFDTYNVRMGRVNEKLTPADADYRPAIDFSEHQEKMDAFKQTHIYDNMRKVEDRDGLYDGWIRMVDAYEGNDLLYLNPKGTIPPVAIIKDRHRKNAFMEKKLFDATSFPEMKAGLELAEEDEEVVGKEKKVDTEG
ncbi:pseudouridine synthase [Roridomyces roridus]|uniref:Pseudouridine synthase n=1 Tax=Roridomyces roridus TaxID=1738132 RepID=A0AAD7BMH3_9AGAR|nr:pseudouridine synthase [Roridomyces roridus]